MLEVCGIQASPGQDLLGPMAGGIEGTPTITRAGMIDLSALVVRGVGRIRDRILQFAESRTTPAVYQEIMCDPSEHSPTYDLSPEACQLHEQDLIKLVRRTHGRGVSAVWIEDGLPYANLMRTREAQAFPDTDVESLFKDYESSSLFLAIIDTRRSAGPIGRVTRGTRVTGRHFTTPISSTKEGVVRDGGSGMAMIRDMIEDGELTGQEFADYYDQCGVNLAGCISVETNFKIGERAPRRFGIIPISQLAYMSLYKYIFRHDTTKSDAAVFAHINTASLRSLERAGIDIKPIAGRDNLRTPADPSSENRYDALYSPVALINTPATQRALRSKIIIALKEIFLSKPQPT